MKSCRAKVSAGKKLFEWLLSDPPSVLVNRETICVSVFNDTFEKPLLQQLQGKKQRWDEFSSSKQSGLAITISATSVPDFQNQRKMLFTRLYGVFSNSCCVMKNTVESAVYDLFTQLQDGRTQGSV